MTALLSEQFSAPSANANWIGQQDAEQILLQAALSGRLPHAWLFSGSEGIGKATLAYRFARFLLSQKQKNNATSLYIEPGDPTFQQIAAGGHNDLKIVEAGLSDKKKTDAIGVDEIRPIAPFLRLTAGQEGWRIVIIDGADKMNRNAQNALLKILEEPGPHSLIILLAENPGLFLPTIRSRCRILNLKSEASSKLSVFSDFSESDHAIANFLTKGSLGQAVRLLQGDGIKFFHDAVDLLEKSQDNLAVHKLSDIYAKADTEAWHWFRKGLLQILYALAAGKTVPTPVQLNISVGGIVQLYDGAQQLLDDLDRFYLDKKQTILSLAGLVRQA